MGQASAGQACSVLIRLGTRTAISLLRTERVPITREVGLDDAEAGPPHAFRHRLGQRARARQRDKLACGMGRRRRQWGHASSQAPPAPRNRHGSRSEACQHPPHLGTRGWQFQETGPAWRWPRPPCASAAGPHQRLLWGHGQAWQGMRRLKQAGGVGRRRTGAVAVAVMATARRGSRIGGQRHPLRPLRPRTLRQVAADDEAPCSPQPVFGDPLDGC